MPRTRLVSIEAFLAEKRIAFAGVSRQAGHFSRMLFNEFRRRGYDVIPVNPQTLSIDGLECFPRVSAIHPAPGAVLVMTPHSQSAAVVEDAARAGVRHVWLYRAVGTGSVSGDALGIASAHGLDIIAGECPFMFFEQPGFPHNLHRTWKSITGSLPA
jgi:predicted CoA-binding protein